MTQAERIAFLIGNLEGNNQSRFCKKAGLSIGTVSRILNGRVRVPAAYPSKIVAAYPQVILDWILTGEGKPFNTEEEKSEILVKLDALAEVIGKLSVEVAALRNSLKKAGNSEGE